ncbi:hypothetical protein BO83DRAFT_376156 [Aspergillus eucalypticola CBS 122712]|uniref:Secreted protein n=1 Tax=Aspergillus eucalypticola (strain CBS 122712 / IBT 29274) TaxID=1448314 RepID=A0A317W3S4_ASPEC|nr:uncharacterized protein BO83DRAFT_376156 [Aspergillus eucalypticola CBS 122712]PWY80231.1 hypothetical protein BO83DRAFT_376156 [Aspergillus eucalypticola CBS 122712]
MYWVTFLCSSSIWFFAGAALHLLPRWVQPVVDRDYLFIQSLSFSLSPWGNCLTWREVSHYYLSRFSVGRWCMHVVVYQLRAWWWWWSGWALLTAQVRPSKSLGRSNRYIPHTFIHFLV